MSKENYAIIEARFRIEQGAFGEEVAHLGFPWEGAADQFRTAMSDIRGKKLDYQERSLPFASLNTLLAALSPSLVHAFTYYSGLGRQALALNDGPRASLDQIATAVGVWVKRWAEYQFEKELSTREGFQAYQQLLDRLDEPETAWRETAFRDLTPDNRLTYAAVPSLIAARLAGRGASILGQAVTWRLAQDAGGRLVLVSQPVYSYHAYQFLDRRTGKERQVVKEGYFAYLLTFTLHTVPGDPSPVVHLHVSCRRYLDKPLSHLVYGRRATVMIGVGKPRLDGWDVTPTLVPVSLQGYKKPYWADNLDSLLADMRARSLGDPGRIVTDPTSYWRPDEFGDEYLTVYSEGMRPNHALETGFSIVERTEILREVQRLCAGLLRLEEPLYRDSGSYGTVRPAAMLSPAELSDRKQLAVYGDPNRKRRRISPQDIAAIKLTSLRRCARGTPVTILILYQTDTTRTELTRQIQEFLSLSEYEDWPGGFDVQFHRVPDSLTYRLDPGTLDPGDLYRPWPTYQAKKAFRQQWRRQMTAARRRKVKEWIGFLDQVRPSEGILLAFVELPELVDGDQNIKGAVREACVRSGISSQMIIQMGDEVIDSDQSRAQNAVSDLLMRQVGAIYGDVREIYHLSDLVPDIANDLTVIGLYHIRKRPFLDYPLAVRIRPDSSVEMRLPGGGSEWHSYLQGTLAVAKDFMDRDAVLKFDAQVIEEFVQSVCLESTGGPTLVLVDAQQFRTAWFQLKNEEMLRDELQFRGLLDHLRPSQLPSLRVVRLREAGTLLETPQYFRTTTGDLSEPGEARSGEGLYECGAFGDFTVYHSIGRVPVTARRQRRLDPKAESGGSRAFRQQRVVEIIPFFLQPEDDPLHWARLTHFLRYTPAWDGGNTVLPLPMHLASRAVDDFLCLLRNSNEDDQE